MRARDFLKEDKPQPDIHSIVRKFLPFVQRHLELSDLPEIELLDQPLEGTFGRYSDGNIRVMAHGRHPIDVLRTLAHELVHYKQDSEGRIHDNSGETGSDEENEANAVAGVIMRDFDQANPELLAALKESRVAEASFNQNFNQIDSIITKKYPKEIMNLLLGMFPTAKEAIVNQYNDEDGVPFAEWRRVIWDIGNYVLSGPVVVNGSKLPIDPETEADRLAKYQQYIKDKDSGKPARYFRANDSDPRIIDFTKLPPITIAQTDAGMEVVDGNHRAFLAKMANKPLRAYVWKQQTNNHHNVEKIKALFSDQKVVAEGAMSDLDLDIQDEHWDGIVGYVINGLKTGISTGRMELYLYKWAGNEMFDLDEELRGRGFDSLYELVDHIQSHGGKYVNPTFDLDGLFGDDEISENFKDGKNPQDKGDSKRHGINTKASVSSLRKTAHQGGRKGQLAHWLANMKSGRAKKS